MAQLGLLTQAPACTMTAGWRGPGMGNYTCIRPVYRQYANSNQATLVELFLNIFPLNADAVLEEF